MGYFSNGTEGEIYHDEYCSKCVHNKNDGCPVMGLHMLYSYELCNEKNNHGKIMLDELIPPSKDNCWNDQCTMFISTEQDQSNATPEILYDGYGVYREMTELAKENATPESVSDVLDAVVRLMKREG